MEPALANNDDAQFVKTPAKKGRPPKAILGFDKEALLASLRAMPEGANSAKLCEMTSLEPRDMITVLRRLMASGEVVQVGKKRGTKYVAKV